MAGLDPSDIASPIRSMLNRSVNTTTLLAEVTSIDLQQRSIETTVGDLSYDYLVVACGASHDYFGNPEWEDFAPGLKTIPQATEIRRRVLMAFEKAERTEDADEQARQMTFVVVGGGPTGVELSGAIAEMAKKTLRRDFRNIDAAAAKIILVEGGERILEQFPRSLSDYGERALKGLGVQVRLGQFVTGINERGVEVGDEFLASATVIWAAGVKPSPLGKSLGSRHDEVGRVVVNDDLTVEGHPNVFVIGDLAHAKDSNGNPLPGLAPVAIQQGRYVGRLIATEVEGASSSSREPFEYFDKGQMATIGRRRAILESGGLQMTGTFAWLGWLFVHIMYLNGFRNRLFVFLSWAWSYATYSRGARLIVGKQWRITDCSPSDPRKLPDETV